MGKAVSGKDRIFLPPGFKKVRKLGEGAASVVWKVRDESASAPYALKLSLKPDQAHRIGREFAMLKRLEQPGIVKVKEFGEHEGREYFTMELIPGEPFTGFMARRLNAEGFTEQFLSVLERSAVILSSLHREGIVHIDVKPGNLLVTEDSEPVLLDFGFAEDYALSPTAEPSGTTLDYAAPELFLGGRVTPAADIYSLGAIAYETLTGHKVWPDVSSRQLIAAKFRTPPGFGKLPFDIPSGLEALILRMLQHEPSLRPSADEVIWEIERLADKERVVEAREYPMTLPRLLFGGRDAETARLEKLVFSDKRIVMLEGESGTGKTRLMRELRFRAILAGKNLLFLEGRGAHLSLLDSVATALGVKEGSAVDKWQRYEMIFQALGGAGFDGVFIDSPLDLSPDEAGFLAYLTRGFEGKLGFILAGVQGEICPQSVEVKLDPLDREKVLFLVGKTFEGIEAPERLRATLVTAAGGNPGRMNELLELLYNEGWLYWKRHWVYEPTGKVELAAKKLETWLGDAIDRLDENSKLVLSMLALCESALPGEIVVSVMGDDAAVALVKLVNNGFIRPFFLLDTPHYEFENDVTRPYLANKLTREEKKAIAGKLARSLEELSTKLWGNALKSWELSWLVQTALLCLKAGMTNEAPRFLVTAGKRLASAFQLVKAKELLEKALECEPEPCEKKDALIELGRIAGLELDPRKAAEFYSQAMPLLEDEPMIKSKILLSLGRTHQMMRNFDEADSLLKEAEQCILESASALKCELYYAQGFGAYYRGRVEEAEALMKKSFETAESPNDKARALQAIGALARVNGSPLKALEYAEQALEFSRQAANKAGVSRLLLEKVMLLGTLGRYGETEGYLNEAITVAKESGYPISLADALHEKAMNLGGQGRFRQARDAAREGLEVLKKLQERVRFQGLSIDEAMFAKELGDWEAAHSAYLRFWKEAVREPFAMQGPSGLLKRWAYLYTLKGNFYVARRMLERARVLVKETKEVDRILDVEVDYAWICFEEGDLEEAKKVLKRCRKLAKATSDSSNNISMSLLDAEILLAEGEKQRALEVALESVKYIEDKGKKGMEADAQRTLGRALAASGKYDEGLARLRESLGIFRTREQPYEQAVSLYHIAETILEREGYSDEAFQALDEAGTIFERLGASRQLERIRDLGARYQDGMSKQTAVTDRYLEGLKQVSELINSRLGKEDFLLELLTVTLNLTAAERGMVFLADNGELHSLASKGIDSQTACDAQRVSTTIINTTLHKLQPIYTADALLDERFRRSQSILLNKIRSFICVPLKTGGKIIGTIYLDSRKPGLFNPSNLLYFETLGNLLAASIDKSAEFEKFQQKSSLSGQRGVYGSGVVICNSAAMSKLSIEIAELARSDANVLLEGETGTGKGVFARLIHEQSPRNVRELCSINCGVLPENIFESELFGSQRGAYTGATKDRTGLLEAADGSTVFFDEITSTSLVVQAKLLEVIEEKVIRRIGESRKRKVDLRFIFATNRDLAEEVKARRFREDLYFRIATARIYIPPLRERREDIPEFVDFFLKKFSKEFRKMLPEVTADAMSAIISYSWPGNVRELRNVMELAVLHCKGRSISKDLLDQRFSLDPNSGTSEGWKEESIKETLGQTGGNIAQAAKRLGISRQHLYRLLKRYRITRNTRP